MTDIIADIDALIGEQLEAGEPETGFDYGDPDYPRCPHCTEQWHGLPITERMFQMRYATYRYGRGCTCSFCTGFDSEVDPEYSYATDDSPRICPGSNFIGPWATPRKLEKIRAGWLDDVFDLSSWNMRNTQWQVTVGEGRSALQRLNASFQQLSEQLAEIINWTNPFLPAQVDWNSFTPEREIRRDQNFWITTDTHDDGLLVRTWDENWDLVSTSRTRNVQREILGRDRLPVNEGSCAPIAPSIVDAEAPEPYYISDGPSLLISSRGRTTRYRMDDWVIFDESNLYRSPPVPQPSQTPPMWAVDPNRSRRPRRDRNFRRVR